MQAYFSRAPFDSFNGRLQLQLKAIGRQLIQQSIDQDAVTAGRPVLHRLEARAAFPLLHDADNACFARVGSIEPFDKKPGPIRRRLKLRRSLEILQEIIDTSVW